MIDRLLTLGYFPKELPPTFQTAPFARFVLDHGELELHPAHDRKRLVSLPGVHNLGRPGQVRRKLQLWNPFSYYELGKILEDGWDEIDKHISQSKISLSKPIRDSLDRRAFITESTGNDLPEQRVRVRAAARYILRTDVARFYHSIYTHSIPWALHGKAHAKTHRTGGLGNEIDRALRNGQDGQTMGIPIGPDTSVIIAEIIATACDRKIEGIGTASFRFIDDFEIGFVSRSAAEKGLARVEEQLSEFELAINPLKTSVEPLPTELLASWRAEIRSYEFENYDQVSRKDLLAYFNRVFSLHRDFLSEPVIAYAVGRLRVIGVDANDWDLYQNLLLQCAIAEPASLPTVLGQMSRHAEHGVSETLAQVLEDIIVTHAPLGHGSEVGWALWAAIWFKQPLSREVGEAIGGMDDPVVGLIALHARDWLLLDLGTAPEEWAARITAAELYDRGWLLAYEAVRRGWLASEEEAAIRGDPNFGPLFEADVSFYDETPGTPVAYLDDVTGYGDFILAHDDDDPEEPIF